MQRRTFLTTTSSCALGYLGLQNYLSAQGSDRVISPYGDLVEDPDGILDLPEGFTYHDDHVGPAKNPWWINENRHSASADSGLVPLSTHSWNQVFDWLQNLEQHRPFLEIALGTTKS